MYPGMAKTAREEGFDDIAEWFETLAKAEKSHAGRFQKMLDVAQGLKRERRRPRSEPRLAIALARGSRPVAASQDAMP